MKKNFFTRFLIVLLTLAFAMGPGVVAPAVAAPAEHTMSMMMDMPGMDMSSAPKGCCPSSDKSQDTKGNTCASACAAMTQAALPSLYPVFLRQVVVLSFEPSDSKATGQFLLPEYPPPKA
jgi:hypothetical protein